jgi:hypothetical protein
VWNLLNHFQIEYSHSKFGPAAKPVETISSKMDMGFGGMALNFSTSKLSSMELEPIFSLNSNNSTFHQKVASSDFDLFKY